jgi:Uma2 family endonuclease
MAMTTSQTALFSDVAPVPLDRDQFVVLHGVDWKTYCALRELFDSPGVRMTYLKGALEIMSPSRRHEGYKKRIARLLELFALERNIPLSGYGSTTFRKALEERGLEPDECYVLARELGDDDFPDIALEVVISSGGINKLEVYRGLGVREVWFWHEGRFRLYALGGEGYTSIERSGLIPELDFGELAALAEEPEQLAALKRYQSRLRGLSQS